MVKTTNAMSGSVARRSYSSAERRCRILGKFVHSTLLQFNQCSDDIPKILVELNIMAGSSPST